MPCAVGELSVQVKSLRQKLLVATHVVGVVMPSLRLSGHRGLVMWSGAVGELTRENGNVTPRWYRLHDVHDIDISVFIIATI